MTNRFLLLLRSIYADDIEISGSNDRKSRDSIIKYTIFANAFGSFTGGAFFTGFALYLGVSDILIGYLGNISTICGFAAFFIGYVIQGFKYLKKPYMTLVAIYKLLLVFTVWIPLIFPEKMRVPVFLTCLILMYLISIFPGTMGNIIIVNLVPTGIRARFYARLQAYCYSIGLILPILAAVLIDYLNKEYRGFFILYNASVIFIFSELFYISKIRDVENKTISTGWKNVAKAFTIPVRNRVYLRFVIEFLLFFIIYNISAIYIDLYMLKYIKISYSLYYIANSIGTIIIIILVKRSGQVVDRLGGKYGFRLSQYLHIPYIFLFILISPGNSNIIYFLICIVRAFVCIYYSVSVFKYRYDLMPEDGCALYDGFFTSVYSINGVISPLISMYIISLIKKCSSTINFNIGEQYRILFIISTIGITVFLVIKDITDREKPEGSVISIYVKYIKGVFRRS